MLIGQLKRGLWYRLRSAASLAPDRCHADSDVHDDSLPRLNRGSAAQSAISRLAVAHPWMSPSLVLTTARAASGA